MDIAPTTASGSQSYDVAFLPEDLTSSLKFKRKMRGSHLHIKSFHLSSKFTGITSFGSCWWSCTRPGWVGTDCRQEECLAGCLGGKYPQFKKFQNPTCQKIWRGRERQWWPGSRCQQWRQPPQRQSVAHQVARSSLRREPPKNLQILLENIYFLVEGGRTDSLTRILNW